MNTNQDNQSVKYDKTRIGVDAVIAKMLVTVAHTLYQVKLNIVCCNYANCMCLTVCKAHQTQSEIGELEEITFGDFAQ